MKKFRILTLLLSLIVTSFAFSKEYSFEQLLEIAKDNSLVNKILKTRVNEIETQIKLAKSDYYPKLRAIVGNEQRDSRDETDINQNNFVGEIRLDYNLYRFGGTKNKLSSLEALKEEEIKISKYNQRKIETSLKKEYFEAIFHKLELSIIEEELKFNNSLKKQVRQRNQQGLVGKADILEVEMRDASLKNKKLQAQEHYQHTLDNIRKITYLSHEEEIDVVGELPHKHIHLDTDKLVETAYKNNIEYSQTLAQVKSVNLAIKSQKAKRLPEVNLRARYGKMRIDEQYTRDESLEGLVGLYVNIPIFDGGEKKSYEELLRIKLEREKLVEVKSKNTLKIDVIHRVEKMQNLHEQIDLAELNIKNGTNYFKNVLSEYKRGVKNSIDLVSARDRLMTFKNDHILAKKNFVISELDLKEIVGDAI